MKTVHLARDHDVPMGGRAVRHYLAGKTYERVLEAHAAHIVAAGAGEVIGEPAIIGSARTAGPMVTEGEFYERLGELQSRGDKRSKVDGDKAVPTRPRNGRRRRT